MSDYKVSTINLGEDLKKFYYLYFQGHFNVRACRNKALKNATNAQVKLKIHSEHLNFRDSVNWLGGDCNFETSEGLFVDEFCLNILDDGNFTAEICEEIKGTEHYK